MKPKPADLFEVSPSPAARAATRFARIGPGGPGVLGIVVVALVALVAGVGAIGAGTEDSADSQSEPAVPEKRPMAEGENGPAPAAPAAQSSPSAVPLPIQLQPYRVRVQIGFESAPQFGEEFRRSVVDGVGERLERYVGEFWHCTAAEERGEFFAGAGPLKRLRAAALPQEALAADVQKMYLLFVEPAGAAFNIAGREWDALTRQLGALAVARVEDRREISQALVTIVHDLFRPVAAVEPSKSGPVTLRARGGEFPPRDASWQPLVPHRTFEAFYCFLNKDRAVERIQQVPFTYIDVDDAPGRGVAAGTVTSGLRAPLVARRRIQPFGLGINLRGPETRLTLITRPPARKPLAGVEVEVSSRSAIGDDSRIPSETKTPSGSDTGEKETPNRPRLVADRNGVVVLDASLAPSGQPVWLFVRSGQALLARVPFVPGVQSADVLELPDDTLRLETEGSVALLQAELVDEVARRAVLMSLAKSRAKAEDWDAVKDTFRQLDEMRRAPSFAVEINAIRIPALKTARARRDRTTEARIQKLCDETMELVTNYLDEEKIRELRDDLKEMRQLATDEAAAEDRAKAGASGARDAEGKPARATKPARQKSSLRPGAPARAPAPPGGPAEAQRITIDGLMTADPLPVGFGVAGENIHDGDRLIGHSLLLTSAGKVSKVNVTIEKRTMAAHGEKVAATKAYVNTVAASFRDAGLKLIEKKIPEIDSNDFEKRVIVEFVYEDPADGGKRLVQVQVFFGESAYHAVIVADSGENYELLTHWALSLDEKAGRAPAGGLPARSKKPPSSPAPQKAPSF